MTKTKVKTDALAEVKTNKIGLAKVENDNMAHSKTALGRMEEATLIKDTIKMVGDTANRMNTCVSYLMECQRRFDNRGKDRGERVIAGFNGWSDFVERGLGRSIRTVQRHLMESLDPIAAETRKADARIRSKAARDKRPDETYEKSELRERVKEMQANPREPEAEPATEILEGIVELEPVADPLSDDLPSTQAIEAVAPGEEGLSPWERSKAMAQRIDNRLTAILRTVPSDILEDVLLNLAGLLTDRRKSAKKGGRKYDQLAKSRR